MTTAMTFKVHLARLDRGRLELRDGEPPAKPAPVATPSRVAERRLTLGSTGITIAQSHSQPNSRQSEKHNPESHSRRAVTHTLLQNSQHCAGYGQPRKNTVM